MYGQDSEQINISHGSPGKVLECQSFKRLGILGLVLGLQVVGKSPVSVVYTGLFEVQPVETRDNRSVIRKLTVLMLMRIGP